MAHFFKKNSGYSVMAFNCILSPYFECSFQNPYFSPLLLGSFFLGISNTENFLYLFNGSFRCDADCSEIHNGPKCGPQWTTAEN